MPAIALGIASGDHCRIGSLEILGKSDKTTYIDHCRIGSLEIVLNAEAIIFMDHCRIGSLEIQILIQSVDALDHCRIGSLEIRALLRRFGIRRSLPHRQLRNLDPHPECRCS